MQYFFMLLAVPFLYFQFKILQSDLNSKIIPNKYLLYTLSLVPFYFILVFFQWESAQILDYIFHGVWTLLLSFILYYYWVWAAGDAKYFFVLSMFTTYHWVVNFFGNIWILALIYLLWYFMYFTFYKMIFIKEIRSKAAQLIKEDVQKIVDKFKKNKNFQSYKWITLGIFYFICIFLWIRLFRIFLIQKLGIIDYSWLQPYIDIILNNSTYFILSMMVICFLFYFFVKILFWIMRYIIDIVLTNDQFAAQKISVFILSIFVLIFIIYELMINRDMMTQYLFQIIFIWGLFYFIARFIFYSYKISFSIEECNFIHIDNLKKNDIIDKKFLVSFLWNQIVFRDSELKEYTNILWENPSKTIQNFDNPIDEETKELIQESYKLVNSYHSKHTENHQPREHINTYETFAFAPYIFLWLVLTYFFDDTLFRYLTEFVIETTKRLISY